VPQIDRLLTDSDLFAGPYTARVVFASAPAVGGAGSFSVSIRSFLGYPLRNAPFVVTATAGMRTVSPMRGSTGPTGVARVSYRADRPGTLRVQAFGLAPGTTMRLAHSPTHDAASYSAGSQRVVAASSLPLRPTPVASGSVSVEPVSVRTGVVGGTAVRRVGQLVQDLVELRGLIPMQNYRIDASLTDRTGMVCGSATAPVTTDVSGTAQLRTTPIAACGTDRDTFSEVVRDATGRVVVQSPPGQPCESFAVASAVATPPGASSVTPAPIPSSPASTSAPTTPPARPTVAVAPSSPGSTVNAVPAAALTSSIGGPRPSVARAAAKTSGAQASPALARTGGPQRRVVILAGALLVSGAAFVVVSRRSSGRRP
jgi:hypothetical protein